MEKKGVSSVPVSEESRPGALPYVLTDIMTYFTMLVGIYFPSVTGEAPHLPASPASLCLFLCVFPHEYLPLTLSLWLLLSLSLGKSLFSTLCVYVSLSVFLSSETVFPTSSGNIGLSFPTYRWVVL